MMGRVGRIAIVFAAVAIVGGGSLHAAPIEILPDSYVFDKLTDTGTYQYHDWTGEQLIDGSYGTMPWFANLGNGPAYEWVGWRGEAHPLDAIVHLGANPVDDRSDNANTDALEQLTRLMDLRNLAP